VGFREKYVNPYMLGFNQAREEYDIPMVKEWISTHDSRTRKDHVDMNGVRAEMDAPFNVGGADMMFPGDPAGPAEQVVNCRCTFVGVLKGFEGSQAYRDLVERSRKNTVDNGDENDIIKSMREKDITETNPSSSFKRHAITQEQIDGILSNELAEFEFPVKPVYNPRIKDNGRTIGEIYKWGELKRIKSIDIGKQDRADREFLIDTILHEYYEAEIMKKQYTDEFYKSLHNASKEIRHEWIDTQIEKFFKSLEGSQ
jgi:hypothetical protein